MSKFRRKDPKALQANLWIQPGELAKGPKDGFYSKLHDVLEGMDFTGQIHRLCEVHYKADVGGWRTSAHRSRRDLQNDDGGLS